MKTKTIKLLLEIVRTVCALLAGAIGGSNAGEITSALTGICNFVV